MGTDNQQIIEEAREYAQKQLGQDSSGHDWWHLVRVARTAVFLAAEEGADPFICELAALLHDIADEKLNVSAEAGLEKVRDWLDDHKVEPATAARIMEIISTISFKGGHRPPVTSKEAAVVQDADRLDALGAIGIARTFAYSGWKGQLIHDPELGPRKELSAQAYRNGKSTAIGHFDEKLLKLKNLMNTASGLRMAESRHKVLEQFLVQFHNEWNGCDMDMGSD